MGISDVLAKEMCIRRYEMVKSGNLRVKVETKAELKQRMGQSPDIADAAFIALDLARQRHGLVAVDAPSKTEMGVFGRSAPRTMRDLDVVSRSRHAYLD